MIIFHEGKKIVGTIDGRVHGEAHLKMWIGDKTKTERLVVQWTPIKGTQDFEPDTTQKDVFIALDKKPSDIFKYKVVKGMLVLK